MSYTLWSRGRLLGESDLGFIQVFADVKFGWFRPSPFGEAMMPVLTGIPPVSMKLGRMLRNPVRQLTRGKPDASGWPADIRQTTAYADLVSLQHEIDALQLELRDPDGKVVDAEDIAIDDGVWKMALASGKRGRKLKQELARVLAEEAGFPRYQIQVHLRGVPRRCLRKSEIELED